MDQMDGMDHIIWSKCDMDRIWFWKNDFMDLTQFWEIEL